MTTYLQEQNGHVIETDSPHYWKDCTKLTQKEGKARIQEQIRQQLRELFPIGSTVYTILKSVSSSGMSRHIEVIAHTPEGPVNVSLRVAKLLGYRTSKDGALVVSGCGMDMGFHVAYSLSRTLWRDDFVCIGEKCRSNDHFNGDKDRTPHKHSDGGYALPHSWL